MKTKDETLVVRVASETKRALQKLADLDKRKLSDYVRLQLESIVALTKKK